MKNYDESVEKNHNPAYIPDHPYQLSDHPHSDQSVF